jgi:hypothetical protein
VNRAEVDATEHRSDSSSSSSSGGGGGGRFFVFCRGNAATIVDLSCGRQPAHPAAACQPPTEGTAQRSESIRRPPSSATSRHGRFVRRQSEFLVAIIPRSVRASDPRPSSVRRLVDGLARRPLEAAPSDAERTSVRKRARRDGSDIGDRRLFSPFYLSADVSGAACGLLGADTARARAHVAWRGSFNLGKRTTPRSRCQKHTILSFDRMLPMRRGPSASFLFGAHRPNNKSFACCQFLMLRRRKQDYATRYTLHYSLRYTLHAMLREYGCNRNRL